MKTVYKPLHSHTKIEDPFTGEIVNIDDGVIELIKLVWEYGFKTRNSCEDVLHKKKIWIEFENVNSAEHFMNLICPFNGTTMFDRVYGSNERWEWRLSSPQNNGWEVDEERRELNANYDNWGWTFYVSLYFPKEDYDPLISLLKDKLE